MDWYAHDGIEYCEDLTYCVKHYLCDVRVKCDLVAVWSTKKYWPAPVSIRRPGAKGFGVEAGV